MKRAPRCVRTEREEREDIRIVERRSAHSARIDRNQLRDRAARSRLDRPHIVHVRVGAAVQMRVEDVYVQRRRTSVRLHEKRGKVHELPCHHKLDDYLHQYLEKAVLVKDPKGFLFRTVDWNSGELTQRPLSQVDAYRMIRRRAAAAGIQTKIGNHTFRATGITAFLKNGGRIELAQQMAAHESARTTGLYDRRVDEVSVEEVERIGI